MYIYFPGVLHRLSLCVLLASDFFQVGGQAYLFIVEIAGKIQ